MESPSTIVVIGRGADRMKRLAAEALSTFAGAVAMKKEIGMKRMNRKDATRIPSPVSPMDGMKLLDAAVQFCWKGTEDGFGYELHYAREKDFSDARSE